MVLDLLMQGVTPTTLALTLFYHWLRLAGLTYGLSEAQCDSWNRRHGCYHAAAGDLLKAPQPSLADTGPTPAMQALGGNIQQLKDALHVLTAQSLSRVDIVRHTDLTNRAVFGLVGACLDAQVHPGLIANVLLYYGLRGSC